MENKDTRVFQEIPLVELYAFTNHPFEVRRDELFDELVTSVREDGIIHPLLVRPRKTGGFEIISGHRRKEALRVLGKTAAPCIVCEMDDDHAIVVMVRSNMTQRQKLLISEKAFALKMAVEAERRIRLRENKGEKEGRARESVGEKEGISPRQVERMVKLTDLNRQLLDLLNESKLGMDAAVELAFLTTEQQAWVYEYYQETKQLPRTVQAKNLRRAFLEERKVQNDIPEIMSKQKKRKEKETSMQEKVNIEDFPKLDYERISRYFPPNTSVEEMNDVICHILEVAKRQRLGTY